ncbi:MAG: ribosome-binding factor A [Candidatus Vogelbacteria bacterium]|nr:ribosome-binding factor A [Candidatus Vogelbacteria bacterium]
MSRHRQHRLVEILKRTAAEYIRDVSSSESLITITDALLSKDGKVITLLINVIPEDKEYSALVFMNRKRHELFKHLKQHSNLAFIPKIIFEVNEGEKRRRRIDELIARDKGVQKS